jgi:hypothetical protein
MLAPPLPRRPAIPAESDLGGHLLDEVGDGLRGAGTPDDEDRVDLVREQVRREDAGAGDRARLAVEPAVCTPCTASPAVLSVRAGNPRSIMIACRYAWSVLDGRRSAGW